MKKCAMCCHEIADKKRMVTVKTGRGLCKKTNHFHLDCFISDKIKARDIAVAMIKS